MSEQEKPKSFMQELDQWTEATVISPLREVISGVEESGPVFDIVDGEVKKAIREKILESYKNGIKAGAKPKAPWRGRSK